MYIVISLQSNVSNVFIWISLIGERLNLIELESNAISKMTNADEEDQAKSLFFYSKQLAEQFSGIQWSNYDYFRILMILFVLPISRSTAGVTVRPINI